MRKLHVLVVGGGFGGIKTALELSNQANIAVTLLSDRSDFRYYPSLYHTATGGLHIQSSIPLDTILPTDRVTLALGTAEKLDRDHKTIITHEGHIIPYDKLVLCLGSVTNYFGIKGLDRYSYGIKSQEDIKKFKAHLHQQLSDDHRPDPHYVIVGAGPTGIELAGALPSYLRKIMTLHGIKHRAINIDLIEAAPRLLPHSSKVTSQAVRHQLSRLGIKLLLGQTVRGETAESLVVEGQSIASHTVIWTAGMANHPFFDHNHFAISERHKVIVNQYLEAESNIYVIGDNAATPFSGMAQTALHDGLFVARNIIRGLSHQKLASYDPKQPITIIPAGPHWAAVEWSRIRLKGRKGWVLRELADFVAFHDYEPWWKAAEQWTTEFGEEESCPVCLARQANI